MGQNDRYSRQIIYKEIGEEGQRKLSLSRIVIIGVGALGSVIANNLSRAGVGFIRLVDRDFVDLSNLQRQSIFCENDVNENLPKAIAAANYLQSVNSAIILDPIVSDVNSGNIESLLVDVDLVLDGTDNLETRMLINEACDKHRKPWIYGGAIMSSGMTMNILPGVTPCFRCLYNRIPEPGSQPTCSTVGVLNMITGIVGCIESTEALKILTGNASVRKNLMIVDIWDNSTDYIEISKSPNCPTCGKSNYEFLGTMKCTATTNLCGRDSIQVTPAVSAKIDFERIAEKLNGIGEVKFNKYLLNISVNGYEIALFKDGRAIIKNVSDSSVAKSIYSEYIGM